LYRLLYSQSLVKHPYSGGSVKELIECVKDTIISNADCQFIAIFDEIDPILNVDSAHDFNIFRGLRDLVVHPKVVGRFKVIIGGLENVTRFENSPNYPLTQLGGSTQVTIMPTQEALHLVTEPLLAAGYTFGNAHVANRILAITNRHPGLIQIFCHHLINYLSVNSRQAVGHVVISDEDVGNVSKMNNVMLLIRKRFDMTLNLDQRYLVIIYSIIDDRRGAQTFDPRYAKEIAECWLPKAFGHLSDRQFEAFLVELTGLGVLKQVGDSRYALRNTNVLKLLTEGYGDDVSSQLERAIENYNSYDPLDRHAYDPEKNTFPSPITCRDEKTILGIDSTAKGIAPLRKTNPEKLTVTLVSGSNALGIDELEKVLPTLYKEDISAGIHTNTKKYTSRLVKASQYSSAIKFQKGALTAVIEKLSKTAPQMIFVDLEDDIPLFHMLALLDASHQMDSAINPDHYPVRIIFLMRPGAYWTWVKNPKLTRDREALQPFIKLAPWATDAVRGLLERLGMNDSNIATDKVLEMTEGWYFSLAILVKLSKDHVRWKDLSDFKNNFHALSDLSKKESLKFLEKTGIAQVEKATPLLKVLAANYPGIFIDQDTIQIIADDEGFSPEEFKTIPMLINWLCDMNIMTRQRGKGRNDSLYQIAPAICHALALLDGDD
jgi:hypothetical protein